MGSWFESSTGSLSDGSEVQEIRDLRHPCPCNVPQPRQFREVGHDAVTDQLVETECQRHEFCDPGPGERGPVAESDLMPVGRKETATVPSVTSYLIRSISNSRTLVCSTPVAPLSYPSVPPADAKLPQPWALKDPRFAERCLIGCRCWKSISPFCCSSKNRSTRCGLRMRAAESG